MQGRCRTGDRCGSGLPVQASSAPSEVMVVTNRGKLVAMAVVSSTVTGFLVARPRHRKLMAIRWSKCASHVAPPSTPPAPQPITVSESPGLLDVNAARLQPPGNYRQPVAFLEAQLPDSMHHCPALGKVGCNGEYRVFVDHGRRPFGGTSIPRNPEHSVMRSAAGSPHSMRRLANSSPCAHLEQGGAEPGSRRVDACTVQPDPGAVDDQRRHDRECCR